jgi:predicted nucleotidyltransferase
MLLSETYRKRLLKLSGIPIVEPVISESVDLNELGMDDIDIPKEYVHDELSPAIWHGGELDTEVREKLLNIAMEFYDELEIDAEVKEIKMPGSMANYNWTEHSDIDVHLFFDLKDISEDENFALEYLEAKIELWRDKHKDIKIKGYPVEVYAQDVRDDYYIGGVYNLLRGKWEIKPTKEKVTIDTHSLKVKIKSIADKIEKLEKIQAYKKPEFVYAISTKLKDRIKKMRQAGLDDKGEFSLENLAFKYLRNSGYLMRLIELRNNSYNKKLSLDEWLET